MTKEQLAQALNGCEYRNEVSDELAQVAKESGLIIIYGASDDLCEITGLNDTELSSYRGGDFVLFNDGRAFMVEHSSDIIEEHDEETYDLYRQAFKAGQIVTAQWCEVEDYGWTYKTDIPHASFEILDDGDKMGRGIVISAATLQYPSQIVAEGSYVPVDYSRNMSNTEQLVFLLRELGYGKGKQLDVALLGLVGEAGEVIGETHISLFANPEVHTTINKVIEAAGEADSLKKAIRKNTVAGVGFEVMSEKRTAFKTELADLYYYFNAVSIETGITLDELAKISHDKVRGKMATPTGSAEQRMTADKRKYPTLKEDAFNTSNEPLTKDQAKNFFKKMLVPEPTVFHFQAEGWAATKCGILDVHTTTNWGAVTCTQCKKATHEGCTVGDIIKEEFVPEWDKINAERAEEAKNKPQ